MSYFVDKTLHSIQTVATLDPTTRKESHMSPATETLQPFVVRAHEGEAHWWFGQLGEIKATAEQTGGAYTLVEITVGPGYGTPLHVHHTEDEAFLVIEGEAAFEVGDQVVQAGPGDFLFGPRDIPHRWSTETGARLYYLLSPGGFEALIREVGVPAPERTVPPADLLPPADAAEIVARHGNAIVG
jgi:mannose-6-phosphate isomerase-like protein (cupin superfamily)